ncbi:MAG: metallopeptidase TldD-related protein [Candidatus Cloacimonadales bacterium]
MQEQLKIFLKKIIADNKGYKYIFNHSSWRTDFLRFYQSQVNYNISKNSEQLWVTLYKGQKSLSFAISDPDEKKLNNKLTESYALIDNLPADKDFVDIEADPTKTEEKAKVDNTIELSLEDKIVILQKFADVAAKHAFKIFGTFICNYEVSTIINSNGVNKVSYNSPIMLEIKGVADKNMVTILESLGGEQLSSLNFDAALTSFEKKLIAGQAEVVDLDPGHYEVVLAPRCIGEYLSYLGSSFGASALDRKSSFFEGKENKQIFPKNITVYDDPHDSELVNFDYNGEGRKIEKLMLIENGVFKNYLVDNYYGNKLGLPVNGNDGSCLVLKTGDKSLDQMISTVKKGIYISSLHYMNFINVKETSLTGLTRDGTFLIENGKITKVVNNLRFTEKISSIIENIVEIENSSVVVPNSSNYGAFSISSSKMPHVKVSKFHISSSTKTI